MTDGQTDRQNRATSGPLMDEREARMLEAQLQQANVDELVDKVISRTSILA